MRWYKDHLGAVGAEHTNMTDRYKYFQDWMALKCKEADNLIYNDYARGLFFGKDGTEQGENISHISTM